MGFEVSPSDYKQFDKLLAEFKEHTGEDGDVHAFQQWH